MTLLIQALLLGYAFFMPITLALAEPCAFVALAVWWIGLALGKVPRGPANPYVWTITIFLCVAFLASLLGVRPAASVPKLSRFLLLGVIWGMWHWPVIWMGYNSPGQPILGSVMIYAALIGTGKLLFGFVTLGSALLLLSLACGILISRNLSRI